MGLQRIFFAMLMASLTFACGDPPLCPSETVVLIDRSPVVNDSDLVRPGVQTTIVTRTSLRAGVPITLEVLAGSGEVVATSQGVTDESGEVSFADVSLTSPRATLLVRANDEICGVVEETVEIDVLVGGDCSFALTPLPLPSAFYAPLDVYNTTTDLDDEPGHQVEVVVQTLPSASVAVFASGAQGDALVGSGIAASGIANVSVTLPEGQVALRVTCTLPGTTLASPAATVVVDTVAPACIVTSPPTNIPITPDTDLDSDLGNGIQLIATAQVAGPDVIGEAPEFHLSEVGGTASVASGTAVDGFGNTSAELLLKPIITPAQFEVEVVARDHAGNPATCESSLPVVLTFVSFAPPAADGEVSSNDGVVSGTTLTFPLCGAVTRDDASVTVTLDGTPVAATVTNRTWCATVSLDERATPHAIVATATVGGDTGSATLSLRVDVTPPTQVGAFAARAVNRQRIEIDWTAPSDAGAAAPSYIARLATAPLTEANFDTTGTILTTGTPKAAGTPETLAIAPVRTGTTFFFGIAAVDSFGNRAPVAISGPLQPDFVQTGAILPPDASDGLLGFGSAIAHGRFNDDDFTDVAIGAPNRNDGTVQRVGAVYVYFGGPNGIGNVPDLVIEGEVAQGRFGAALAALRRSSTTREDLVVGAPGGDGTLFIYQGGASFGTGTRLASTAGSRIGVDSTNPGWFASSGLGNRVVTADVDGDGLQDLVASAPTGDGGAGGAVILYGGTIGNDVRLSDLDPTGSGTTVVELIRDPAVGTTSRNLGFYLWTVGATEGPLDATDDLVLVYGDDQTTAGDSLFVFRGDGTRPVTPGVTTRVFVASRDVRIDFVTTTVATDWGAAVATIEDQDGDGARELVVSAYRQNRTVIIAGDIVSASGVVTTSDPGVVRSTFNGGVGVSRLGVAIANNDGRSTGDVDGDGREELVIGGTQDGVAKLFVWFGGSIPTGTVTASSATFVTLLAAPNTWRAPGKGQGGIAAWVADINGDGLDDICVASPVDNSSDGLFEVLFDENP